MKNDNWTPIEETLPVNESFEKFHVKMQVGSMITQEVEAVILGKLYATGFRFMSGDWQRVTHWKKFTK